MSTTSHIMSTSNDCAPMIVMDHVYDGLYKDLTSGHCYAMFEKVMVVLQDGAMLGITGGQRRPLCKYSEFMANKTPLTHYVLRISEQGMEGTMKDGHTYLNKIVATARELSFPLYGVGCDQYIAGTANPYDMHVFRVTQAKLNVIIDFYREIVNRRAT